MSNIFYLIIFFFVLTIGWSFFSRFLGIAMQIVTLLILIGVAVWVFRQAGIS